MTQHWATMKEAGALGGMRFMVSIYSVLGRSVFNIVLVPVMAYFFVRRGSARRASMGFLRRVKQAYPDIYQRQVLAWLSFRHFLSFGQSLLDKYIALAQPPSGIAMGQADETMLFELVESGQGCLIIGSHFGNLEYSRGISARHPELVINVLMYDKHAEKFASLLEDAETETRMNVIQVTDIDLELAFLLKEKVQRGEWVIIAGDRVPVGESQRVCSASFFGDNANFPVGPYVLAKLLHCPVYLLHCFHVKDHYQVAIEFFEEEFQSSRKNRQQSYDTAAQKFASALEKQVVRYPLQWFNFYDFWEEHNEHQNQSDGPTKP